MRTTIALDDELLAKAQAFTGLREKSALVREALKALIERESGRRLARLGGHRTGSGDRPAAAPTTSMTWSVPPCGSTIRAQPTRRSWRCSEPERCSSIPSLRANLPWETCGSVILFSAPCRICRRPASPPVKKCRVSSAFIGCSGLASAMSPPPCSPPCAWRRMACCGHATSVGTVSPNSWAWPPAACIRHGCSIAR